MTTDEKLQKFYDSTLQAASAEADQIVSDYQEALDRLYADHVDDTDRRDARELSDEKARLKREMNKEISARQLTIRRELSRKTLELKSDLFSAVEQKLLDFKKTEDYIPYLCRKIQEAHEQTASTDASLRFFLDASDSDILPRVEKAAGVTIDLSPNRFMGGLRTIVPSRNILIDNSFSSMLEEAAQTFTLEGGRTHV